MFLGLIFNSNYIKYEFKIINKQTNETTTISKRFLIHLVEQEIQKSLFIVKLNKKRLGTVHSYINKHL